MYEKYFIRRRVGCFFRAGKVSGGRAMASRGKEKDSGGRGRRLLLRQKLNYTHQM